MEAFTKSFLLLFVLLDPFILSVYLLELVKPVSLGHCAHQLFRACLISFPIFLLFTGVAARSRPCP